MTESKKKQGGEKKSPARGKAAKAEVFEFKTEMQQLLQIIIHSLYAERDIFLRELISNASDALNKLKFVMQTRRKVRDANDELEITLEVNAEEKWLVISDNGIGLSREEAIANLGTIARSGTLEFVKEISAAEPGQRADLIGQFGVGFYSVFMVATRVVVDSCPADPDQPGVRWISEGHGQYEIATPERTKRGTTIRIELKDDAAEFATSHRLEGIVQRYSSFIQHPIRLDGRRLNVQEAIWSRSRDTVSDEQYREFYQFITHSAQDPLHWQHFSIDAPVQFQALLYVPGHLTNEVLYSPTANGIALYANRVLIQQESRDLLPLYLRFMRGVVDTEDLPLNVSRETIQNNPLLARLRTSLTGKALRDLKTLSEKEHETYLQIWRQYGKVIKEGLAGDFANQEKLLELCRFNSSACADADELITLADYTGRMKEDQKEILYFTGPSRMAIENNPHLEYFRRKGLEVLYLYDQVDDFVFANMIEYQGKTFASIDQAGLESLKDADGEESPAGDEALGGEALAALLTRLKDLLGERVSEVRASKRLVDSPALLVSLDGVPGNLGKMMKMLGQDFQATPKVLEINPAHELIRGMAAIGEADPQDPLLRDLAGQLLDNCLLMEGLLEQPETMVGRIQALMTRAAASGAKKG